MNMRIEPPHINGKTTGEKLGQVIRYLFQLSQTLNWIISTLEKNSGNQTEQEGN